MSDVKTGTILLFIKSFLFSNPDGLEYAVGPSELDLLTSIFQISNYSLHAAIGGSPHVRLYDTPLFNRLR